MSVDSVVLLHAKSKTDRMRAVVFIVTTMCFWLVNGGILRLFSRSVYVRESRPSFSSYLSATFGTLTVVVLVRPTVLCLDVS